MDGDSDKLFEDGVKELRIRYHENKRQKSELVFGISIHMRDGLIKQLRDPIERWRKPATA